ncbi:hypothetical protein [Actinomadura nitritigenes]|uniref:Uncharacterized protein n=1 Tax=Actinomadura nitritigenes TaxID=134602 RepID=A0ABS3RB73_9ACTN|nr:hypothetical protein [Actinomadura nitritigenes]MBO2443472.1 hypothetical protein [Actinomadura nitritigenes]
MRTVIAGTPGIGHGPPARRRPRRRSPSRSPDRASGRATPRSHAVLRLHSAQEESYFVLADEPAPTERWRARTAAGR